MSVLRVAGAAGRPIVTAFGAGALFGIGLVVSGMTEPSNIVGFLDVAGDFRPALALVMMGAVLVYAVAIRLPRGAAVVRREAPRTGHVDAPLVLGAAVFGAGWGLGGYCPGPSIVAMAGGRGGAVVFFAASVVGLFAADAVRAVLARPASTEPEVSGEVDAGQLGETA